MGVGVADLIERYSNNWIKNRLSDIFVPFLTLKLKQFYKYMQI